MIKERSWGSKGATPTSKQCYWWRRNRIRRVFWGSRWRYQLFWRTVDWRFCDWGGFFKLKILWCRCVWNKNDLNLEVTVDIYQNDPNKTLNLRSGPKQVVQNPRKKAILPPKQQSDPVFEKKKNQDKSKKVIEVE